MIGRVGWDRVVENAKVLAALGGPEVGGQVKELTDLRVTGPVEARVLARAAALIEGGISLPRHGTVSSLFAYGQNLDRLLPSWAPVGRGDVLLNLFGADGSWEEYHCIQKVAERTRSLVIPMGPWALEGGEGLLDIARAEGVNAVAGTPSALVGLADTALAAGAVLPVRNLLWARGTWDDERIGAVGKAFPEAGLWGLYGDPEAGVLAFNDPRCLPDHLHLLDDQVLETDPGGALLTRGGQRWTAAVVRYRLADRVEAVECACGRPNALRVVV